LADAQLLDHPGSGCNRPGLLRLTTSIAVVGSWLCLGVVWRRSIRDG